MAKITPIDNDADGPTHPLPPPRQPRATRLITLSVISIVIGLLVNLRGLYGGPQDFFPSLDSKPEQWFMTRLDVLPGSTSHPYLSKLAKYSPETSFSHLLWLGIYLFRESLVANPLGKGLFIYIYSSALPILTVIGVESVKPARHPLLGPFLLIGVTIVAMTSMVGTSLPVIYIPVLAHVRWTEVKANLPIRPLPSPGPTAVNLVTICNVLALGTVVLTSLVPTNSEWWITANFAFQCFPLLYLPILLVRVPRAVQASTVPRLASVRSLQVVSYLSFITHVAGVYLVWPSLRTAWSTRHIIASSGASSSGLLGFFSSLAPFAATQRLLQIARDGEHLLIWDLVGVLAALYLVVLVESEADDLLAARQGGRRVHAPRFLPEDIIMGVPGAILLGPGWAAARYWQRREMRAEKARWNVLDKDE